MSGIQYRPSALADLDAIHDFIVQDDPAAARRVVLHIRSAIERLSLFPHSGRMSNVANTYELVVPRSRYIATFVIVEDHIEVVGVFHAARERET